MKIRGGKKMFGPEFILVILATTSLTMFLFVLIHKGLRMIEFSLDDAKDLINRAVK